MKSLINLVKKDFLQIKKYIIVMLLFSIIAPIFISFRTPEFQANGFLLYMLLIFMLTFMTYHMISIEEMKHKGMIYIQTTPMPNHLIALSKIIVVTIVFFIITGIFVSLSKLDITKVGSIEQSEVLVTFLLVELFFSIYVPLTFKLGYVKLQIVSASVIFLTPFLIGLIPKKLSNSIFTFLKFNNISNSILYITSLLILITLISISIKTTCLILNNKEY
ncbi:ABC-2 transporter permease [Clostridium sp. D2Q-11]|uniref:ABC-2 transporter permease n=1 Tax=Anaeromonas frigoriresistens TaxID=2683708 RepID=A0A942V1S6_9FIRM|nr:ABC-2 transporter permease [Anaeromonas frigoriresistens]MBS4539592.1 ABC-2 transporter permease [Anaeromonas frigoriresistens]